MEVGVMNFMHQNSEKILYSKWLNIVVINAKFHRAST